MNDSVFNAAEDKKLAEQENQLRELLTIKKGYLCGSDASILGEISVDGYALGASLHNIRKAVDENPDLCQAAYNVLKEAKNTFKNATASYGDEFSSIGENGSEDLYKQSDHFAISFCLAVKDLYKRSPELASQMVKDMDFLTSSDNGSKVFYDLLKDELHNSQDISFEVKRTPFGMGRGYEYDSYNVDALYLKIGDKSVFLEGIVVGHEISDETYGEHVEEYPMPVNEAEVDTLLGKREKLNEYDLYKETAYLKSKLKDADFEETMNVDDYVMFRKIESLLEGKSAIDYSKRLVTESDGTKNTVRNIFNTMFFDEYRQQLVDQANRNEIMYINPAMKNPKTGEDVRATEIAKLQKLKEDGYTIIGLEMTEKPLAALCDRNIDPQHTGGDETRCCTKEIFEKAPEHLGWFKSKNLDKVVFVTNRVDVDSVAASVLAKRYLKGEDLGSKEVIEKINEHDAFQGAKWDGPKPIEQAFDPENKTAALASSLKVFTMTSKNIEDVKNFIDTGNVEESVMNNYRTVQNGIIERVKSGEIKTEVVGGVAYVETTLPCATNVGYSMAPIVVAVNPAMKLGPQGEPFRKVSICQHEAGYADLNAVAEKLNEMEAGWGGSPTFKGSKQGENCNIPLPEIKKMVFANLTPEYKAQVTAAGKANIKSGRDE